MRVNKLCYSEKSQTGELRRMPTADWLVGLLGTLAGLLVTVAVGGRLSEQAARLAAVEEAYLQALAANQRLRESQRNEITTVAELRRARETNQRLTAELTGQHRRRSQGRRRQSCRTCRMAGPRA